MTLPPGFLADLATAGLSVPSSESLPEDAETEAADLRLDGFELLLPYPGALLTCSVGLVLTEVLAGDLLVGERALLTPLIGDGLACANLPEVKIKAATNTFKAFDLQHRQEEEQKFLFRHLVVGCLFEMGVLRLSGHVRCIVDRT